MNTEKHYIPGTDPKWNRTLPEGYDNEIVDSHGNNYDNGYNFEEPSDPEDYETTAEKQRAISEARGKEALKDASKNAQM